MKIHIQSTAEHVVIQVQGEGRSAAQQLKVPKGQVPTIVQVLNMAARANAFEMSLEVEKLS